MFLGINYDKWHGIIAALSMVLIFAVLWLPSIKGTWEAGFCAILYWGAIPMSLMYQGFALLISHWLQCWNESWQARDPHLEAKYGTWQDFIANSRTDFRWFWRGAGLATIINLLIMLLSF